MIGEEVCRVGTTGVEGEYTQGRCGEASKDIAGFRGHGFNVVRICMHFHGIAVRRK